MTAGGRSSVTGVPRSPPEVPSLEIPAIAELAKHARFVGWRTERRGDKQTKVPVQLDGRRASVRDPATWTTYDEAAQALLVNGDRDLAGLGFVFTGDDPYVFIDLDDCLDLKSGAIEPWAQEIVDTVNSYTEVSPSGTGLHIFARSQAVFAGNKNKHLEIYSTKRFATLTVWHLDRTPETLEQRDAEVDALRAEHFPQRVTRSATEEVGGIDVLSSDCAASLEDDVARIEQLLAAPGVDDQFWRTWQHERPDLPDQSRSAYDLALVSQAAAAGWSDALLHAMIVAHRRRYGGEAKAHRGDYVRRTIAKARARAPHAVMTADPAIPHWVAEINATHAVVNDGGKTFVVREACDPTLKRQVLEYATFKDFEELYVNQQVTIRRPNGRSVTLSLGDAWLRHPARRTCPHGACMLPGEDASPGVYNTWRGFGVEPAPGDWSLFYRHLLDNVCGGDEVLLAYVLGWLARCVQRPAEPGEVALVLRGGKGTGKSIVGQLFGWLLGQHFLYLTSPQQLVGRFNNHLRDAVFVVADEALLVGNVQQEAMLKALITEHRLVLEAKFRNPTMVRNCVHLMIVTNHDWAVLASVDERRFLVLDVAPHRQGDVAYFAAIVRQMEQGGLAGMLHDLLQRDLTGFEVRKVPATRGLTDQKLASLEGVAAWWFDRLMAPEESLFGHVHGRTKLYEDFREWCERSRAPAQRSHVATFWRLLLRLCPSARITRPRKEDGRSGPRVVEMPPLGVARVEFMAYLGAAVDWGDGDG